MPETLSPAEKLLKLKVNKLNRLATFLELGTDLLVAYIVMALFNFIIAPEYGLHELSYIVSFASIQLLSLAVGNGSSLLDFAAKQANAYEAAKLSVDKEGSKLFGTAIVAVIIAVVTQFA